MIDSQMQMSGVLTELINKLSMFLFGVPSESTGLSSDLIKSILAAMPFRKEIKIHSNKFLRIYISNHLNFTLDYRIIMKVVANIYFI